MRGSSRSVAFLGSNGVATPTKRCSTSLLPQSGQTAIFAWVCDRSGGNGAFALCGDFPLGAEPVVEVVAVFPAAFLVELIRALADLVFESLGAARHCSGWFLCRIFGHGGHSFLLLQRASRVRAGGKIVGIREKRNAFR